MAEPVFFLAPKFESADEQRHRLRLKSLSDEQLDSYGNVVQKLFENHKLVDPWKKNHIQEERERRNDVHS